MFKNKQEMLLELMKSLGEIHYGGINRLISETEDVREKIRRIIRFHYMDESKPFHDMVGVWVEFWGQSPHDREVPTTREDAGQVAQRGNIALSAHKPWLIGLEGIPRT